MRNQKACMDAYPAEGKMDGEGLVSSKYAVKDINLIGVGFEKPLENEQTHLWFSLCLESGFAVRVGNGWMRS